MRQWLFWPAPSGGGPIAVVGSAATFVQTTNGLTHTLAYTVGAGGSNRKLIVAACSENTGGTTHSMTYNGIAMSSAVSRLFTAGANKAEIFYADDANLPTDAASHNIVLTTGDSETPILGTPGDYVNVAQGAPSGTNSTEDTSGALLSILLTGVSAGALLVDAVTSGNNTTFTPGGSQAERFDVNGASDAETLACAHIVGAAGGDTTVTQQIASGAPDNVHVAAWWAEAA